MFSQGITICSTNFFGKNGFNREPVQGIVRDTFVLESLSLYLVKIMYFSVSTLFYSSSLFISFRK